tara:strand:+ start:461 stop:664 length:204 start_codon:yes stop_codon:yes gene_type:complete
MSNKEVKKVNVPNIIDEIVGYMNPSKEDLEKQIEQDKVNYAIWQCGVAIKELQSVVDQLTESKKEAS